MGIVDRVSDVVDLLGRQFYFPSKLHGSALRGLNSGISTRNNREARPRYASISVAISGASRRLRAGLIFPEPDR
jgi:hypothetical protein